MILELKKTYYMTFSGAFASYNGIYSVVNAYGYDKLIEGDIDITATLKAIGIADPADIDKFAAKYRTEVFYELFFVNGNLTIFVPMSVILNGDPDVFQFYNTMLAVDLGPFKYPEVVHPIAEIVVNAITHLVGKTVTLARRYTISGYIDGTSAVVTGAVTNSSVIPTVVTPITKLSHIHNGKALINGVEYTLNTTNITITGTVTINGVTTSITKDNVNIQNGYVTIGGIAHLIVDEVVASEDGGSVMVNGSININGIVNPISATTPIFNNTVYVGGIAYPIDRTSAYINGSILIGGINYPITALSLIHAGVARVNGVDYTLNTTTQIVSGSVTINGVTTSIDNTVEIADGSITISGVAHLIKDYSVSVGGIVTINGVNVNIDGDLVSVAGGIVSITSGDIDKYSIPNAEVQVYSQVWMTNQEYLKMLDMRKLSRTANPNPELSGIMDWHGAYLKKVEELVASQNMVSALTDILNGTAIPQT